MIDANITNTMLKLRTNTHPWMSLYKHLHPELNLTDKCPLCNLDEEENIHHIIYNCPKYAPLRKNLKLPILSRGAPFLELLTDISLTNFNNNHPHMLKIYEFLQLRWKLLNQLFKSPHLGEDDTTIEDGLTLIDQTTSIW